MIPASAEAETPPEQSDDGAPGTDENQVTKDDGDPLEVMLEAVLPALPPHLLEQLEAGANATRAGSGAASKKAGLRRGRPVGSRPGQPGGKARLHLIDTLRAAAPWQKIRRPDGSKGVQVRRDDFRIVRYKEHHEATAIFVVDASGSAAAQRLAEAKGAVELLLADSYVRRDRIALIAFRGKKADVLLPPTRSLQRAKRALAALPGGGGTPLGDAIAQARQLADQVRRGGGAPLVVFLTDGRANISRGGAADRSSAMRESAEMARTLRSDGTRAMIIDISASPHEAARALAANMAATYVALPHAGAQAISQYVAHAMPAR
jgi:magnesium chelatase subunit D